MKIGDHVYITRNGAFCGTITDVESEFVVCKTQTGWFRTNDLHSGHYTFEDPFVRFVRETLEGVKTS